ncbi:undecaprenyl-diphosphate phosphatase [Clostridium sp. E02]|uniref:undecaprenyl-diphosphate phosphatase n=1 Tax=Clostridium sp. E02 TaxID=2487134 RepID=UPI000F53C3C1|nr:undecaprenyl-diphosphate phosphatase [Clostridium sp. E02]
MNLIEFLKVIVLGIVEGFTEWLPISSTGHMILVDQVIRLNQPQSYKDMFMVVIQLGAILAVVVLYFEKLNPFSSRKKMEQKKDTMILWSKIVIACLPAAIIGLLLNDLIEKYTMNAYVVSAALIIYGVLFILIENKNHYRIFEVQKVGEISYRTALYIGLFQCLAMIPGTSRSGSTILGAMILGCSRTASAEFSFFLGIPVMFGASLLKIVKYGMNFTGVQIFYLIFGMIVAFLVSIYSIKFLMGYIRQHDFKFFGYYRIILGVIVIAYFCISALLQG